MSWETAISTILQNTNSWHRLRAPCPVSSLFEFQQTHGAFPPQIAAMLRSFNGAELFVNGGPVVTFFGLKDAASPTDIEWVPDWYIDVIGLRWQQQHGIANWPFAINNYDGLVMLKQNGTIDEWDIGCRRWIQQDIPLDSWADDLMEEGEAIMNDPY